MVVMTSDVVRHLGLAQKLIKALDAAGYTPIEINDLAQNFAFLAEVRSQFHAAQQKEKTTSLAEKVATKAGEEEVSSDAGADFFVEVEVRNGYITRCLKKNGHVHGGRPSFSQLMDRMSLRISGEEGAKRRELENVHSLKILPVDDQGGWKPLVVEMATALGTIPERLFPGRLRYELPKRRFLELDGRVGEPVVFNIL